MSYAATTYTDTTTSTSIFTNDSTATITFTNTNPVSWLLTLKQGTDIVRKRGIISQYDNMSERSERSERSEKSDRVLSVDSAVKKSPANPDAEW
jgi:hypothetical protein